MVSNRYGDTAGLGNGTLLGVKARRWPQAAHSPGSDGPWCVIRGG